VEVCTKSVQVLSKWSRADGSDEISMEADSARDCATHRWCARGGPPSGKRQN